MNKIYRIIWNHAVGQWVVSSELSNARGKRSKLLAAAVTVALALPAGAAMADDTCLTDADAAGTLNAEGICIADRAVSGGIGLMGGLDGGTATGVGALAVGPSSRAAGENATALGSASNASSSGSVAVGHNANTTTGGNAVAIGYYAKAGSASLAGGTRAEATTNSVALGGYSVATADRSTAVGSSAQSVSAGATALGNTARAAAANSTAIGRAASVVATGTNAVALGQGSVADRTNTVSIGAAGSERQITNVATGTEETDAVNVAQLASSGQEIRNDMSSLISDSLESAVMYDGPDKSSVSFSGANGTVLKNITAGDVSVGSKEAVNGGQLHSSETRMDEKITNVSNDLSDATRFIKINPGITAGAAQALDNGGVAIGASSLAQGSHAVAVGPLANAIGVFTTAVGNASVAEGANSTALGTSSRAYGNAAVAVGRGTAFRDGAIAIGHGSIAGLPVAAPIQGSLQVAIGDAAGATGDRALALGGSAKANAANSVALGAGSIANRANTISVGLAGGERQIANLKAGEQDTDAVNVLQLKTSEQGIRDDMAGLIGDSLEGAVIYDAEDKGSVTFGGTNGTVLKNVATGEVAADSSDAVNGSQLHATNQQVEQNTSDITNVDKRVTSLDGRVATIDGRVTNIDNRVSNIEDGFNEGSIGLVRQDATSRDITVAAGSDGGRIVLSGTAGDRVVSGVAAGSADNDAVNIGQLKAAGLVGADGSAANLVAYDSAAKDSITLGGSNATQAVKLKNVADATEDDEAVNLAQLKAAGLVGEAGQTLDAVTYDANSGRGQITFAGANGTVLANVGDGRIQSGSRDAVNGGQIAALRDQLQGQIGDLDNRVTSVENNAGAGSDNPYFDANGNEASGQSGIAPLPAADAEASGAGAVAAGNGAKASGNASVAVGANAEAKADNSVALGAGSVADRDNTVSVGHQGGERQLTNVAAGVRDTDGVNVSQLNQRLAEAKDYTDQRMDDMWNGVNDRINHANRQANRGIAGASALVQVTPYLPGKTVLNAGMATYRGESAMGVGISRWNDSGRVNVNAGVSVARGDSPIFRVGVGVVLGD